MSTETTEQAKVFKVVLIGEAGVGKTCLLTRFISDTFNDASLSTTNASYAGKLVTFPDNQNQKLKYEIWDTAGQEIYKGLTKIFYKNAGAAILVYDITRKSSFEEITDYWYNELKNYGPKDLIVGMAANKNDLYEQEEVSEIEARKYAKKIGAIFHLTSAADGSGVEDLFLDIGKRFIDPNNVDLESIDSVKLDGRINKKNKNGNCC